MSSLPSILLVGTESAIRSIIVDRFRECGFRVVHAADFQEAVALLGSHAVSVDLVFSDAHIMDERDGLELARWARVTCPGLPVIFTTGAAADGGLCDQLRDMGTVEELLIHATPASGLLPSAGDPERAIQRTAVVDAHLTPVAHTES